MGKAGRFACIFVPMALTIASLICLILVEIGTTNTSSTAADIYFLKIDMTGFTNNPSPVQGTNALVNLKVHTKDLKDYYQVGLWNYCSGNIATNGNEQLTFCSSHQKGYYFDPAKVWGLSSQTANQAFGDQLTSAMNVYQKAAGWQWTAYIIACVATGVEIVVGFFAIFSRWGSFVTTIVSGISTAFTVAASATATAIYLALVGGFDGALHPYNIDASIGGRALGLTWLAAAFSIASGFFWFLSVCCCSGKSSSPAHVGHKHTAAEKTPYTYERVQSPMLRQPGAPRNPHEATDYQGAGGAYEPYRHV